MTYKEKLIKLCKVVNKRVKKSAKGFTLYNQSDYDEIKNDWSEIMCKTIFKHVEGAIHSGTLLYDTQLSPWCLKQKMDGSSVSRDRFFYCVGCTYAKRHKMCCCDSGNTYDKVKKKLKHCKIIELPKLMRDLTALSRTGDFRWMKKEKSTA